MYYYDYTYPVNTNISNSTLIWTIISIVVAIIGGVSLYFSFLDKSNENKYSGFTKKLYDFLNFKTLTIDSLMRMLYLILTIAITLLSFNFIKSALWQFLLILIGGNIILRMGFEVYILYFSIYKNIKELNEKNKK